MLRSESITNIAGALAKFKFLQNKINRDGLNPFHKSKYPTLDNILEKIEPNLQEADLVFAQFPDEDTLTTILIHHPTGEFMQASYKIRTEKNDPQGWGSALSYAKRYALSGILGLSFGEDDDAEKAMGNRKQEQKPLGTPVKAMTDKMFTESLNKYNAGDSDIFKRAAAAGFKLTESQKKTVLEQSKLINHA